MASKEGSLVLADGIFAERRTVSTVQGASEVVARLQVRQQILLPGDLPLLVAVPLCSIFSMSGLSSMSERGVPCLLTAAAI